ncbi:hypothetical protein SCA03_29170 [Streptomyces cacaoi]|uniref:Uncharacterized protein n=1 Tax=Streptomyces cacaoi TaxID=1898 RepID=A0A4Y3QY42_STRCI|nr:hypothetical protein SCA03_29170 [Streptomyces cacaoi]
MPADVRLVSADVSRTHGARRGPGRIPAAGAPVRAAGRSEQRPGEKGRPERPGGCVDPAAGRPGILP